MKKIPAIIAALQHILYSMFWIATFYGSKLLLFRMRVDGKHNIPKHGAYIIAANHIGHIDPYILGVIFPRQLCYIANSAQFKMFVWGSTISFLETIEGSGFKAIRITLRRLAKGDVVVFFPEGERVKNAYVEKALPGAAAAAIWARVPVVPVMIKGTGAALNVRTLSLRMGSKIHVTIGAPITFDDSYHEGSIASNSIRATDDIVTAINMLDTEYCQPHGN